MPTYRYTTWKLVCPKCDLRTDRLVWDYELENQKCETCEGELEFYSPSFGKSAGVVGDEIPGGIEIKHGLVDPVTLAPMKFYSRTELKRAANEYGLTLLGDTPKPYRVRWDGVRKTRADEIYDKK
ncbi:MAG: hypothetical protein AB7J46_06310 [Candidatus Altimarinota bacterium]